jgi:hypothetical protein
VTWVRVALPSAAALALVLAVVLVVSGVLNVSALVWVLLGVARVLRGF